MLVMNDTFLEDLISEYSKEEAIKKEEEKRRQFFQTIGKKGGLAKKNSLNFSKVVSVRFTEKEFEKLQQKADKHHLKLSQLLRLICTQQELRINEFAVDETLLQYGNHFVRISNLLRNHEWNQFENKQEIWFEIQNIIKLIKEYIYQNGLKNE